MRFLGLGAGGSATAADSFNGFLLRFVAFLMFLELAYKRPARALVLSHFFGCSHRCLSHGSVRFTRMYLHTS